MAVSFVTMVMLIFMYSQDMIMMDLVGIIQMKKASIQKWLLLNYEKNYYDSVHRI
jgi:hypothetical protein